MVVGTESCSIGSWSWISWCRRGEVAGLHGRDHDLHWVLNRDLEKYRASCGGSTGTYEVSKLCCEDWRGSLVLGKVEVEVEEESKI